MNTAEPDLLQPLHDALENTDDNRSMKIDIRKSKKKRKRSKRN